MILEGKFQDHNVAGNGIMDELCRELEKVWDSNPVKLCIKIKIVHKYVHTLANNIWIIEKFVFRMSFFWLHIKYL